MTNSYLSNIPFYAYVAVFTLMSMLILGSSYIKVSQEKDPRSNKMKIVHTPRFGMDAILLFGFGGATLFVLSFVKMAVDIPSSFFFKVLMFALMVGLVFVIALVNVGISMFVSNIAVNLAERNLDR